MARSFPVERLQHIYAAVCRLPGARPAQIARRLGLHRSEVTRSLPALEEHGLLLWEDEEGRLWPYPFEGKADDAWKRQGE